MSIRIAYGSPVCKLGDRVREIDGRHEGTIRAVVWSNTIRVVWDDTGWVSDLHPDELEIVT